MARVIVEDGASNLVEVAMPTPPPEMSLHFPQKAEVQPEGFDGLGLDDRVTVTISGKLTRISSEMGVDWGGKGFSVAIESCVIEGTGRSYKEKRSLGEAVDKTRRYIEDTSDEPGPGI